MNLSDENLMQLIKPLDVEYVTIFVILKHIFIQKLIHFKIQLKKLFGQSHFSN